MVKNPWQRIIGSASFSDFETDFRTKETRAFHKARFFLFQACAKVQMLTLLLFRRRDNVHRAMNKYEKESRIAAKCSPAVKHVCWHCRIGVDSRCLADRRLSRRAPPDYFYKGAIGVAVLMLLLRQISRRLKTTAPRSSRPDPKSTLKLT